MQFFSSRSSRWAALIVVAMFAAACGGGDTGADGSSAGDVGDSSASSGSGGDDAGADDSSGDSGGGDTATPSGSFAEVNGEIYEFDTVLTCVAGDDFWGPDFRRVGLGNGDAYPGVSVGYAPPKADNEGGEDPNEFTLFPSEDPWWFSTDAASASDLQVTLVDGGVTGTATVGVVGDGGPDGEFVATFELMCDGLGSGAGNDSDSSGDDSSSDGGDQSAAPGTDTGTVIWAGEQSDLSGLSRSDAIITLEEGDERLSQPFDFEICETVNPAFAGEFNVGVNLVDGTEFWLTGTVGEEFDEFDGLFLGEIPDQERAENLEVSLNDRTLSGSATTSRGDIEFTFTC